MSVVVQTAAPAGLTPSTAGHAPKASRAPGPARPSGPA